ncbi:MAG: hypothetical protein GTO13_04660 [Proteobacteria bacterium]|nr:hypothetical protein [Pseudomonadota bacterium]
MRIAVKYCGNCNPEIDAPRIIGQWMEVLGDDEITFQPEAKKPADLLVIICGCRKACVDRSEIRAMGKEIILIKGGWIDGHSSGEHEAVQKLVEVVESIRKNSDPYIGTK